MAEFNFSFHTHLNESDLTLPQRWAFIIKAQERLHAYGYNVKLFITTINNKKELAIGLSDTFFDSNLNKIQQTDSFKEVDIKKIKNIASWGAVGFEQVEAEYQSQHNRLSQAIDESIDDWVEKARGHHSDEFDTFSLESKLFSAVQNGFDIHKIYFHETERKNAYSLIENGFDLTRVGNRGMDYQLPDGAFLKPTSEKIGVAETPIQIPFMVKKVDIKEFHDRRDFSSFLNTIPNIKERHDDIEKTISFYDAQYENLEQREGGFDPSDGKKLLDEWRLVVSQKSAECRAEFSSYMLKNGISAISIKNDQGTFGRSVESLIVLEPSLLMHSNALKMKAPKQEMLFKSSCDPKSIQDTEVRPSLDTESKMPRRKVF